MFRALKGFRLHFQTMSENFLCLFLQLLEIPSLQSPSPEIWQHSHGMSPVGIEMRITTKVGGKRKHAMRSRMSEVWAEGEVDRGGIGRGRHLTGNIATTI